MKKKKLIVGIATAVILAGGTGTGVYAYNQNVAEQERLEQVQVQNTESAQDAVDALYNKDRTRLADDIEVKIKKAEDAVAKLDGDKKKTLSKEVKTAKDIADVQNEVYSTLKDGVLVDNVTDEQLDTVAGKLSDIKNKNQAIYTYLVDYLADASTQLNAIQTASEKVAEAEKSPSRKSYDDAIALVEDIKTESKKAELKKKLSEVEKTVIAAEEDAKRKKEEEEKKLAAEQEKAQQEAAQETAAVTSSSNGSSSNNTTQSNSGSATSSSNQASSGSSSSGSSSSGKSYSSGSSSSGSSSSSNKSYSSGSSSSSSNSSSGSSKSSSSQSNSKGSSSNSSSSKSNNSSDSSKSSGGNTSTSNGKQTGGGDIKNNGEYGGSSGGSYTEYEYDQGDMEGVPWGDFSY